MDRRAYPRVPLDEPMFIRIQLHKDTPIPAMLIDISAGGLQIGVPPSFTDLPYYLGKLLRITGLPTLVDTEGKGLQGQVIWVGLHRCGIRLTPPLALGDRELKRIFASL